MLRNTFPVCFYLLLLCLEGVFADSDEVKSVSVTEGDSVTLNSNVTAVQTDDLILWMFGPQETRIANIQSQNIKLYDSNTAFEKRLQMDNQTGSLTIRNIRSEHTGLYKLQIISRGTSYKRFNVNVYAPLPAPVISSNSSNCSSSSSSSSSSESRCSLVCSAVNVSHVTLSWFKGNSLLSSISVSDLSISLSLPLEVDYQDKNIYSCVLNNPIRNHTTHLDITKLCHTCSEPQTGNIFLAAFIPAILLVGLAGIMYFLYRKYKRTAQKMETAHTEVEEVQYAETVFLKQNGQNKKPKETEEMIYSSVVT